MRLFLLLPSIHRKILTEVAPITFLTFSIYLFFVSPLPFVGLVLNGSVLLA